MKKLISAGRAVLFGLGLFLISAALTGCGSKIIFTSSVGNDEIISVGELTGREYEFKTYLTNMQRSYENKFGSDVFTKEGNETVFPQLKQNALSFLTKVKALNMMAQEKGTELSEDEKSAADNKAQQYFDSLSEEEKTYLGVDLDKVRKMYEEYDLSQKMYDAITAEADTKVSDDEARTVTVQAITIVTYSLDESGNKVEFDAAQKEQARQKAEDIVKEIRDGMDNNLGIRFDEYVAKYNEEGSGTYTIGRDESDTAFMEAAFRQPVGSFSDPVETADGYRIIKGIASSDQNSIDARKEQIIEKRKEELFETVYNDYANGLDARLNEKKFSEIELCTDDNVKTCDFFLF